jgi:hypothetical protein
MGQAGLQACDLLFQERLGGAVVDADGGPEHDEQVGGRDGRAVRSAVGASRQETVQPAACRSG